MQILLFFLCIGSALSAQKRTITGRVTDVKDGSPLAGVSVQPKGDLKNGTVTNSDGSFTLSVGPNVKFLTFSIIGYGSEDHALGSGPMLIALSQGTSNLNEIVVIGYGTARKKDLTGAVTVVDEKQFQKGTITTPEQMIAGKVPGVSIISNSGEPGAGSTIRIRGGSSLSANNNPLIVVDGVPLNNDVLKGQNSVIPGAGSALSFINPNDIESFTVLKDASATAIYGARAAAGVIIITTKKGGSGSVKFSLTSANSVSTLIKQVPVLSAAQFRSVVDANATAAQIATMGSASTSWQDQIFQTAFGTNDNLSISGGIKKLPYRISVGYQDQNGILKTDYLKKTSAALTLSPVLFDNHLKIDVHLLGALESTRFGNNAAIGAATSFDPTQPVYSKSARFGGYWEYLDPTTATGLKSLVTRNPLGLLEEHYNTSSPKRSIGNIQLDYKFHWLPDLHANVNAGYDVSDGQGHTRTTDSAAETYIANAAGNGENNPYKLTNTNTLFEAYLSYAKDLRRIKSHVDVLGGYSFNNYLTTLYHYPTYYANGVMQPSTEPATPSDKQEHTLISYFGRANFNYNERYLLTATLRDDGSSRFAPGNRWALFPSAALAWNIKNESFLTNANGVSQLKLRLGYGLTGQQDGIGNYDYLAYYSLSDSNAAYIFGDNVYQGYRPAGFYSTRRWEQTATSNAGLDYGFFNNRIFGSIDVYYKKTTNLLNNVTQAAGSNFSAYIVANVGSMTNQGVEFNIGFEPIRSKDLTWDVAFNVTYNKNKITNLTVIPNDTAYPGLPGGTIAGGIGGGTAEISADGGPKNTFYLYRQVYNTSGQPIEGVFVDKNNDGIINQNDLYKSKPADPQTFLGFTTNVTWRRLNAGFVLRSSLGMYDYNNIWSQTGNLNQIIGNPALYNASANYLTTHFRGVNAQNLLSDYYLENASFLRMDNIYIGYNFGAIQHTRTNLRITAGVQNVFVITKYKGLDPEIGANTDSGLGTPGIDNNLYPRPRVYNLGLNLDF
jgi:TonB-linked SusC/RagA family outer membrane protein